MSSRPHTWLTYRGGDNQVKTTGLESTLDEAPIKQLEATMVHSNATPGEGLDLLVFEFER